MFFRFRAAELQKRQNDIAEQRRSLQSARNRHLGQTDSVHRAEALEVVVFALQELNKLLVANKEEPEGHTEVETEELNPLSDDAPNIDYDLDAPDPLDDNTPAATDSAAGDPADDDPADDDMAPVDIMGDLASKESEKADKESASKDKPVPPNRVLDDLLKPLTDDEMDDL